MDIEGRIINMRIGDDKQIYMAMKISQEEFRELHSYAKECCCEDYDEELDFYYEFFGLEIEFNVTGFITDIHEKYFNKGNRITKFPFDATFNAFYCPMTIRFHILAIV